MKRGKPSAEDLKVISFEPAGDRLRPPANLKPNEARLFREVVASCPASQFGAADTYLLASFARITLLVDRAVRELDKARPKDRPARMKALDAAIKSQCLLATKLRLTTSSRHDVRKLSRQHSAHRPSYYDTMTDDNA
jgi:hypothetical protein